MPEVVILGGGPAGLAAAYELSRKGKRVAVIVKGRKVGGLSGTSELRGCKFDLGPHIFIKRNERIVDFWKLIGQGGLFEVQENSKQYINGAIVQSHLDFFFSLPVADRMAIVASLLKRRIFPIGKVSSLKDQMVNDYGEKMYSLFDEIVQRKYSGLNPSELEKKQANRAAQKASVLSLARKTALTALRRIGGARSAPGATGHRFFHHKYGSGHMYDNLKEMARKTGNAAFHTGFDVVRILHDGRRIVAVEAKDARGRVHAYKAAEFIFTIPLNRFVQMMHPKPPAEVLEAAGKLFFRNLVMVNLVVEGNPFEGQWIQIISDDVSAYRVTNFCNLSRHMGSGNLCPVGVEYNCFEGDALWKTSDKKMIELAKGELDSAGLVEKERVVDASVLRVENAYPVYFIGYEKFVSRITGYLSGFENLQPISRQSIYRYNNMGHAVESGLLAADSLLGKAADVKALSALDGSRDIYNNT